MTDIFPEEGGWGVAQHGTDTFQRGEVGKGGDVAQAEEGQKRGVVALRYFVEGGARCLFERFIPQRFLRSERPYLVLTFCINSTRA